MHNPYYLYFNRFILIINPYSNSSLYYFKLKIWNFFNYSNILLIDDFLLFYINNYMSVSNSNFKIYANNTNTLKYFIYVGYKTFYIFIWLYSTNVVVYHYNIFNKFISLICT